MNSSKDLQKELQRLETIDGLPAIELPCPGRTLGEFAEDVGSLLAQDGIYQRGGLAFRVVESTQKLEAVGPQFFRTWAEQRVRLYKTHHGQQDSKISLKQSMTIDTANALVVSPQFLGSLPTLARFQPVRMPVVKDGGHLELLSVGYDTETETLTSSAGTEYNTQLPFTEAVEFLDRMLCDFPFADDRSKAVSIASMLTVYAGGVIPKHATTPAFIYQANAEGSGKTTLAKLSGAPYGAIDCKPAPTTETEWQKRLLALTMSGRRVVLLDNLRGHLNSPSLEAYLTATRYGDRVLGQSKEFEGDADAVLLVTGNGLTVTPDMRRRVLVCELFMRELRAEDRTFKYRLDDPALLKLQPDILASLWALVRNWDSKGRPKASRRNASFPAWCDTIAGMVEAAGFACPTTPAELETGGDTDTRDISRLGDKMLDGTRYTFSEITDLCAENGFFERLTDQTEADGQLTRSAKSILSKTLLRYDGRTITEGHTFHIAGKGHSRKFYLEAS